jgi:hypothetical protein
MGIEMSNGQMSFVPVHCTETLPPPEYAADSECKAVCDNTGQMYLCKKNTGHPYLAASEWICSHLARSCGLPMRNFAIVQIEGKKGYFFGSEWVDGALGYATALPSVKNREVFSQALAFDYGAHNPDRHLENYLYFDKSGDVLAELIDFSRAFLVSGWPLPDLPMDEMAATVEAIKEWRVYHPFDTEQANAIIGRWVNLPNDHLQPILASMAPGWLDAKMEEQLIEWWKSPSRNNRAYDAHRCLQSLK